MTTTARQREEWPDMDVYTDIEKQLIELADVEEADEICRRRAEIVTNCLPLADNIARRFNGRGEPNDDLVQVARLGLVKVVDRYDPRKGRFIGYAAQTIIGEVRRHFRDNTWAMRVPRSVKDTRLLVRDASNTLAQRLGRAPTASELAGELDVGIEDVVQAMEAAYAYRPLSLDATVRPGDTPDQTLLARQGAEDPRYETVEDAMAVAAVVPELSDREQAIVRMRFCECLSQNEIGRALGISQVHVSRLLSAALERIRTRLWSDMPAVLPVVVTLPLVA